MPRHSQAQLIHAKASAKAQLINAHQMGGGGGGSAPLVRAPAPTPRRDYTRFSPVTEVGGDKKKDKPTGVAIADNVDVSGKGRTVNDGSGLTQWRVGNKRFTQAEFDNIMERGMRGASLNAEQRAVFEASRKEYEDAQAEKKRLAEEQRVRDIKQADAIAEEQRRNDEYDRRQKVQREAALAEEQRRRGYAQEDFDRRQQAILDAAKREADAEAAKYEALNARHGIEKGVRLSAKDYNDLEAGRVVYDYSKQDNDDIRSAAAEIEQKYRNGEYDQAGYEDALRQYHEKVSGMKKSIRPNENPPTAEQLYNGAFAAPDGTRLLADGKGGLVAIPGTGPQKEAAAKEPTMKGLTFKDVVGMFRGRKVPTGQTDDDGNPIMRDMNPDEMIAAAQKSWKPDANVPAPTGSGLQLLSPGNLSHEGRPWKFYTDDSGKIAGYGTTRSTYTKTDDGNFAVIPTIVNGEELSLNDAVSHYKNTGEHWGVVRSESEAKMLAEQIHQKEQSLNQKAWNDYIHNNWDKISPSITGDKGMLDEHNRRTSYAAPQPKDIKNKWSQYAD